MAEQARQSLARLAGTWLGAGGGADTKRRPRVVQATRRVSPGRLWDTPSVYRYLHHFVLDRNISGDIYIGGNFYCDNFVLD